jgi:hypothetical protein
MIAGNPTVPVERLFSTAAFRDFFANGDSQQLQMRTDLVREALDLPDGSTNYDAIVSGYDFLRSNRRSEYYYKNLLANKIWLAKHRSSASMLYELKVAGSIADAVLLGRRDGVYEIKSELDSPRKLDRQIASYYKAFTSVTIVCDEKDGGHYVAALEGSAVGVMVATSRFALRTLIPSRHFSGALDLVSMFKVLRQAEAENIVLDWFGELPDVPSGRRFSSLLDWSLEIPLMSYQQAMYSALKRRGKSLDTRISADKDFLPLRALLVQLAPGAESLNRLYDWMSRKEYRDVLPITAR